MCVILTIEHAQLVLLNFGRRVTLLCSIKTFFSPLLMWFLEFLEGGEEETNCAYRCGDMKFKVSHIFKKDNNYTNKLANLNVDNKLKIFESVLCLIVLD